MRYATLLLGLAIVLASTAAFAQYYPPVQAPAPFYPSPPPYYPSPPVVVTPSPAAPMAPIYRPQLQQPGPFTPRERPPSPCGPFGC
jgi:hypothetical protein